ncbi:MAG: potassium-transporting ATPase subunit KdpC [Spirochaetia bacterium]|nr:potassium-transporting ATPase subunit KdpC [Spirochaetia bacterium]
MKEILRSLTFLLFLTIFTGLLYPLLVTGMAQLFVSRANGSLVYQGQSAVGSELIAQNFAKPGFFHSRPSAADFATVPSGASNAAATNKTWQTTVLERRRVLQADNPGIIVPGDLLAASASGLDPHISPEAAYFQLPRIMKARKLSAEQKKSLEQHLEESIEHPQFEILGQERINVLMLNLWMEKNL